MKISELATQTGVPVSAIRHYEAEALLSPPVRGDNNYRRYMPTHVEELTFVRNCRTLNMTFDEIRALKSLRSRRDVDCSAANKILIEHLGHIDAELERLSAIRGELETLRAMCVVRSPSADCEMIHGIVTRSVAVNAPTQAPLNQKRQGL